MSTWKTVDPVESALSLPAGRYAANFGFLVEQSVNPEHTLVAAQAIKESGKEVMVATQASLIVKAQELEVAFQDWAELKTF